MLQFHYLYVNMLVALISQGGNHADLETVTSEKAFFALFAAM